MFKLLRNEATQSNSHYYKTQFLTKINQDLEVARIPTNVLLQNQEQINTIDLDQIDCRFLLAGTVSGSVHIYDTDKLQQRLPCTVEPVGSFGNSIDCLQWNPVDNGFFTCSSRDQRLGICDPNTMKLVNTFKFTFSIYHHHMSPVAANHSNIAIATSEGFVTLCDLRTGNKTTTLSYQKGSVKCVQWNPLSEYMLASGGGDGVIRLWDIRRGKMCYKHIGTSSTKYKHLQALIFNSSGTNLICFRKGGFTSIYNTCSYKEISMESTSDSIYNRPSNTLALACHTNPEILFIPHHESIRVYNTRTGKCLTTYKMHLRHVIGLVHNPRHNVLYSYGTDKLFLLWVPKVYNFHSNLGKRIQCAWSPG